MPPRRVPPGHTLIGDFVFRENAEPPVTELSDEDIVKRVRDDARKRPRQPRQAGIFAPVRENERLSAETLAKLSAEALRQAAEEGLEIERAQATWRGVPTAVPYKGVKSLKGMRAADVLPYQARLNNDVTIGCYETMEQAALARARYLVELDREEERRLADASTSKAVEVFEARASEKAVEARADGRKRRKASLQASLTWMDELGDGEGSASRAAPLAPKAVSACVARLVQTVEREAKAAAREAAAEEARVAQVRSWLQRLLTKVERAERAGAKTPRSASSTRARPARWAPPSLHVEEGEGSVAVEPLPVVVATAGSTELIGRIPLVQLGEGARLR